MEPYWVIDGELAGRAGPAKLPWDLRELRQDFGAIVSLDEHEVEAAEIAALGFWHMPAYRPMLTLETETEHRRFLELMPAFTWFVDRCRAAGRPVVVHCHYGCDRTGCTLGCYLIAREGFTPLSAYEWIRERNPHAYGQAGYAEALLTFDKLLKKNPRWLEPPA